MGGGNFHEFQLYKCHTQLLRLKKLEDNELPCQEEEVRWEGAVQRPMVLSQQVFPPAILIQGQVNHLSG